jgi:hypothetical protein
MLFKGLSAQKGAAQKGHSTSPSSSQFAGKGSDILPGSQKHEKLKKSQKI